MNFKEQTTKKPTVKVRDVLVPHVYITTEALRKMFVITDEVKLEVGWLGTATREGNNITIHDVFLLKQQVHATTTELTPEGLAEFAQEILAMENGVDIWNNMKMWGHSHVNMGITPSGQDNSQMEIFSQSGHDFFVRLICNKKGDLAVDVYDYELGMEFHNTTWSELVPSNGEEAVILDEIKKAYERIETLEKFYETKEKAKLEELKTTIKPEIASKVSEIKHTYVQPTYYGQGGGYQYLGTGAGNSDYIKTAMDVYYDFDEEELYKIAISCKSTIDLSNYFNRVGINAYSYKEVALIFAEAKKVLARYKKGANQ